MHQLFIYEFFIFFITFKINVSIFVSCSSICVLEMFYSVRESVIFVGVVGANVKAVFGLCGGIGSISRVLGCGRLGYY